MFPLYYMTLLLYIVLVAATRRNGPEGQQFFHHLPAFATYTSNWFVDLPHGNSVTFYFAWSLAIEEQFYLLWPPVLVATLMLGRRRVWPPLVALMTLVAMSQGAGFVADTSVLPGRIPASLPLPILLGAAAALMVSTPRGFALVAWVLGRTWSATVIAEFPRPPTCWRAKYSKLGFSFHTI